MNLNLTDFSEAHIYHIMIQTIIPRPIAWVLSSAKSNLNLAPFSFFMGVASSPPTLALSVGQKDTEGPKDTWRNIEENRHFVVHIPSRGQEEIVSESSATLPRAESEIEHLGLKTVEFEKFPLPRLEICRAALGCTLDRIIEVGTEPQGLILGKIQTIYLSDEIAQLTDKKRVLVDPRKLDPVARLGGIGFGFLGDTRNIPRPK